MSGGVIIALGADSTQPAGIEEAQVASAPAGLEDCGYA